VTGTGARPASSGQRRRAAHRVRIRARFYLSAVTAGAVGATWEVVAPIAAFGCWTCGLALALVLGREIRRARG
jgi:hypothetical protein